MGLPKSEYRNYIRSDDWQETRKRYWRSKLPKFCWCCGCSDKPLDLHHATYKTLGKENLNHLHLVCRDCHLEIHEFAKVNGVHIWVATKKLHMRWKKSLKKEQRSAILQRSVLPSLEELLNRKNWTKERLETWGVMWPPRRGWFKKLKRIVERLA